ncbi:hypothetical protein [Sulfitobacter dubius]|uniref:Uncharacterized protein n=1 Tax=Sulfitobacter dubius TaxID=218673 RepID=A0ABY3ZMG4_9RHOB|nr:hypothetical protein [Sulfitobacter dubius]UOA15876.1 hypothetical protein DSM109990_02722 [Sulfitobacter dubius]
MTEFAYPTMLKKTLALDAATCVGMGLLLVLASGSVSGITQIPAPLLFWAGLILLPVACFMMWSTTTAGPPVRAVFVIVAGNFLWVLVRLVLPMTGTIAPNTPGWVFLLAQAAVVALFAVLEWSALPSADAAT